MRTIVLNFLDKKLVPFSIITYKHIANSRNVTDNQFNIMLRIAKKQYVYS